jgi:hypothetical protein
LGPLPPDETLNVARQIARALEAADDNPADTAMMTEIGVSLGHGA